MLPVHLPPSEMRSLVVDGAVVAIGGAGLNRKPMGLVRSLGQSGASGLSTVSLLGSLDVEYLIATEATSVVHTSGTALDGMGLAPRYRAARQTGSPDVIEWSEGSLAAALEAGARGLGSMPCGTSPRSDLVATNPYLTVLADPFTGEPTVHARAITPHIGLIQGSAVDSAGNIHIDGDPAVDALVATASRATVASVPVEEDRDPRLAAVSRIWIDRVVVDPDGAWPTACAPSALVDLDAVGRWAGSGGADTATLERCAR